MATQRYEIEAWLGDDHGLADEQIDDLVRAANEIAGRYPNPDNQDEREAALAAAYRLMAEAPDRLIRELALERTQARVAERRALAALRQIAVTRIGSDEDTESGFARRAGLDRMAVRRWLGKR